ncbi:MAG: carboxylating nicotinate-nucleotide diphosphorylase [Candidatus Marinimicrobia bacterium]|jgi:nicotinate-nucleotide pyrophosphorylase (carboxylating)|nr:carboxylating nicotinate-nucleotide diphosphorylase [Candidatus Neomarinimicrobiota bacterium]MEE1506225.1 carboxylating nicotinate-nucleotide diphosphorylase [Candidatus Neomarinimicrobiota bacterium]MEE1572508.1 carboxylating nicotinate-nucleotide diphosphorylase [Candidatus Neomarinimicrobiota bacterium]|tara:strand:+ start:1841 stop:2764 length:924 start_codon:yes stop_codon:yes gene_type:complete
MRDKLVLEFWDRKSFFKTKEYYSSVKNLINEKIKEDFDGGDITTDSLIDKNKEIKAVILSRGEGIVAGIEEVSLMLNEEKVTVLKKDGNEVKNKDIILEINGNARKILAYERTLLNIMQRMSGIVTAVYNIKKSIKNNCLIAATRKTLFPLIDKKAVSVGGALTHRLTLNDAALIKHTHMKIINNDLENALRLTAENDRIKYIEIEIKNEAEALKAAEAISNLKSEKLFAIMFDNMECSMIRNSINEINNMINKNNDEKLKNKILFEASGEVNENNIEEYSKTGVDVVSIGLITHSSKAVDMSLQVR